MSSQELAENALVVAVAEQYRSQGFDVTVEPQHSDLPFDLGGYLPDLIAKRKGGGGLIIDVKRSGSRFSVERYREIAEQVSQHADWRFLLITSEDPLLENSRVQDDGILSLDQIRSQKDQAERLLALGESSAAFILLWGILEALMRRRALDAGLPIERFPTRPLINNLYSEGEISMSQFDRAKSLQQLRNSVVHGFRTLPAESDVQQLHSLVNEVMQEWVEQAT